MKIIYQIATKKDNVRKAFSQLAFVLQKKVLTYTASKRRNPVYSIAVILLYWPDIQSLICTQML